MVTPTRVRAMVAAWKRPHASPSRKWEKMATKTGAEAAIMRRSPAGRILKKPLIPVSYISINGGVFCNWRETNMIMLEVDNFLPSGMFLMA